MVNVILIVTFVMLTSIDYIIRIKKNPRKNTLSNLPNSNTYYTNTRIN
ncbi:MAG: hypothetical protein VB130_15405 [Clostridium sp.]|nr:hypothetical protein [Clostridium sp.]